MYRCNRCLYKTACQGAHGSRTCEGFVQDNEINRKALIEAQKIREQVEFETLQFASKLCTNNKGEQK